MCSKGKEVDMGFTGETFPPGIHMCYIYNDEAQRKKVISKFLESGLLSGEKTSYFMDVITIDEMNEYFSSLGLDIRPLRHARQIRCLLHPEYPGGIHRRQGKRRDVMGRQGCPWLFPPYRV
jgi:hypothetical protein